MKVKAKAAYAIDKDGKYQIIGFPGMGDGDDNHLNDLRAYALDMLDTDAPADEIEVGIIEVELNTALHEPTWEELRQGAALAQITVSWDTGSTPTPMASQVASTLKYVLMHNTISPEAYTLFAEGNHVVLRAVQKLRPHKHPWFPIIRQILSKFPYPPAVTAELDLGPT